MKTERLNIRMSEEEKKAIDAAAKKHNTTLTEFLVDSAFLRAKELRHLDQNFWDRTLQSYQTWLEIKSLQDFRHIPEVRDRIKSLLK